MNGEEKSIVVVSDIHLGAAGSNHEEFSRFLGWLVKLQEQPYALDVGGEKRVIHYPGKLILLGDVLELWDPIDDRYVNTAMHLFESIKSLLSIDTEIIYVTGNHDEALEDYKGKYPMEEPGFRIYSRHFPQGRQLYLELGEHKYFFLHGHQFDKLFRWAGPLAKIPSIMAGFNSILSGYFPLGGWSIVLLFAALLAVHRSMASGLGQALFYLTVASGFLSIPRVFTYLQTTVWSRVTRVLSDKPKYKDINRIIDEGYYDPKRDSSKADVIVYGHTHIPEICREAIRRRLGKTFVNTGSWVRGERGEVNTLVYIDSNGLLLLRWNDEEKKLEFKGRCL